MTVKCLSDNQKRYLVEMFESKIFEINDIAYRLEVSRRTVIRVLEEKGIDPGIRRRSPKPAQETQPELEEIQQPMIKEPWFHRIINKFCQVFNPEQYGHSTVN